MGYYFKTARAIAAARTDHKVVHEQESVRFSIQGWDEFSTWLKREAPEIADLIDRFNGPVDNYPSHPTYKRPNDPDFGPLSLAWTADECRRLFMALSHASRDGTEPAYDFWEFLALVSLGIVEDGVTSY